MWGEREKTAREEGAGQGIARARWQQSSGGDGSGVQGVNGKKGGGLPCMLGSRVQGVIGLTWAGG